MRSTSAARPSADENQHASASGSVPASTTAAAAANDDSATRIEPQHPADGLPIVTAFSSDIRMSFSDFNALRTLRASVARYPHNGTAFNTWYTTSYDSNGRDVVNLDPCTEWNGVRCENGRVTELKLHNMNLDGYLPDLMPGALPMLRTLMFTNNKLKGSIPSSFGYLTSLQNLLLNLNTLSGSLPTELGKLTVLENMSLDGGYTDAQRIYGNPDYYGAPGSHFGNQFTGTIPEEFGQLSQLTHLNLHRNFLQGTLPWAMSKLTSLQTADLSGNNFSGPLRNSVFANLKNARELLFDDNHLSGTLPPGLQLASSLEVLVVEGNQLSGPLPAHLPPRATFVDFHTNAFTGTVPAAWGTDAPMVNVIMLHDNRLHGSIPKEFAQLAVLHTVSVALNEEMCGEDPGLPMPKPSFLKNECDKVFEMCALWPETRGTKLYTPCDINSSSSSRLAVNSAGVGASDTCAETWEQCGGAEWLGPSSCCTYDTLCVNMGTFYSQCMPKSQACGDKWAQCGGRSWNGPACCLPKLTCRSLSPTYSQCQP